MDAACAVTLECNYSHPYLFFDTGKVEMQANALVLPGRILLGCGGPQNRKVLAFMILARQWPWQLPLRSRPWPTTLAIVLLFRPCSHSGEAVAVVLSF